MSINDNEIKDAGSVIAEKISAFNESETAIEEEVVGNAFYIDWATYDNCTANVFGTTLFDDGDGAWVDYYDSEVFDNQINIIQKRNPELAIIIRTVQETNGEEESAPINFSVENPNNSEALLAERLGDGIAKCLAELSLAVYETEDLGFSIAMYPEMQDYGDEFYILMRSAETLGVVDIHRFVVTEGE